MLTPDGEFADTGLGAASAGAVPKVSVVVPAYNVEAYVFDAVASALAQTERRIEIVLVEDRSTDRTLELLRTIRDPRVKLLVNGRNMGLAASRNRGIAEARGDGSRG
jgi:succinoglycan biosynthesis protein ExoO